MKLKAEFMLDDCLYALSKHSSDLQGEDFRISWLTIITLLRAIGHVLSNVDSLTSDKHKMIIDKEFEKLKKSKPKPEIFWLFIIAERNRFLKEYDYGVRRQFTQSYTDANTGTKGGISILTDKLQNWKLVPSDSKTQHESFITTGAFKGQNELNVAFQAANWWKKYLNDIKLEIENK